MKATPILLGLFLLSCVSKDLGQLPPSKTVERGLEAGAKSSRYPALSDARLSAGGSFVIHWPGFSKKKPPNRLEKEAMELCAKHFTKWGFTAATEPPADYIISIKFEVLTLGGRTAQTAKVHVWENKAPSYDYLWKGTGVSLGDPPEAKLAALQAALSRFPN